MDMRLFFLSCNLKVFLNCNTKILLVSFIVLRTEHSAEPDIVLHHISTLVIGTSRKEIKICLEQNKENCIHLKARAIKKIDQRLIASQSCLQLAQ